MTYKIKKSRGRPKNEMYKIRRIKPITPKGYIFDSVEGEEIKFKKKEK